MGLLARAATADDVLLWLHGRRIGILGDGEFQGAANPGTTTGHNSALVLDGQCVASNRMSVPFIQTAVTSLSAAGAVALGGAGANAAVGDTVVSVIDCSSFTDVSADFESTISVAGQIQQKTSTSGHQVLVTIFPRS